jgi:bifunctional DNA-binding transcriptional regulator/antitoxin component of YhaV-PrlF toxin-antitoxin module
MKAVAMTVRSRVHLRPVGLAMIVASLVGSGGRIPRTGNLHELASEFGSATSLNVTHAADRARGSRIFPTALVEWYDREMHGTYNVRMGDRGRLVVPAELRERAGFETGTPLVLIDTPRGVVLLTRQQLKDLVRADLEGLDLVDELLEERRRRAREEDAA